MWGQVQLVKGKEEVEAMNRRQFLKRLAIGTATSSLVALKPNGDEPKQDRQAYIVDEQNDIREIPFEAIRSHSKG